MTLQPISPIIYTKPSAHAIPSENMVLRYGNVVEENSKGRTVRNMWRTAPPNTNKTNQAEISMVSLDVNQDSGHRIYIIFTVFIT